MNSILICAATIFEIQPLLDHFKEKFQVIDNQSFKTEHSQIDVLITGVGMTNTALQLARKLTSKPYNLVFQLGIAGSFRTDWKLGKVLLVLSDCFADLGVEHADGSFESMQALKMLSPEAYFDDQGRIWSHQPEAAPSFLPFANGITVNTVHGSKASIAALKKRLPFVEIESMEGAAFLLACREMEVPAFQIRALSNYVEPRNRDNWQIELAIRNLNDVAIELLADF